MVCITFNAYCEPLVKSGAHHSTDTLNRPELVPPVVADAKSSRAISSHQNRLVIGAAKQSQAQCRGSWSTSPTAFQRFTIIWLCNPKKHLVPIGIEIERHLAWFTQNIKVGNSSDIEVDLTISGLSEIASINQYREKNPFFFLLHQFLHDFHK